ncbi:MAG: head-tail connector protein, partial [Vicinamibacteraceae bacterium]
TQPTLTPITVADLKACIRTAQSWEDALYESYILSATRQVERALGRPLMNQTIRETTKLSCGVVRLSIFDTPVTSVGAVTAIDSNGTETSIDVDDVVLDKAAVPYEVRLKSGTSWPANTVSAAATLTVGYTLASQVPADVAQLVRFVASYLAEHRDMDDSHEAADRAFRYLSSTLRARVPFA